MNGLGAGIFGGDGVLGTTEYQYPWHEQSQSTLSLQIASNVSLTELDMPLVGEDGVLGGETCGAQSYLASQGYPEHATALQNADCRAFDYPPTASPSPGVPVAPPPPSVEEVRPRARASMGAVGWLLIAGGVATAGVYLATRKKR